MLARHRRSLVALLCASVVALPVAAIPEDPKDVITLQSTDADHSEGWHEDYIAGEDAVSPIELESRHRDMLRVIEQIRLVLIGGGRR